MHEIETKYFTQGVASDNYVLIETKECENKLEEVKAIMFSISKHCHAPFHIPARCIDQGEVSRQTSTHECSALDRHECSADSRGALAWERA